jgi:UMF1 family MFS transporter
VNDVPAIFRGRRVETAWCLYDFANSAFATTILAVLFTEYFARVVAGGMEGTPILGRRIPGPTLYTILLSASLLFVALLAPLVGTRSDRSGRPVRWLMALALPAMIATTLLSLLGAGDLGLASIIFPIAVIGFALSGVVYNGLLPRISTPETMGRLSGWGWGFGYLGGGLVLALNLALLKGINLPFGLSLKLSVPATFPITAVWWGLFTIPLLAAARHIPESPRPARKTEVLRLLAWARGSPNLLKFLLANLLYGDGVQTVVAMASIFAATVLGWAPEKLVVYFLAIQGTALLGSPVLGRWADHSGDRPVLMGCLVVWIAIALATWQLGWSGRPETEYWILGLVGGFVLGPTQSLSRSLLGRWTPPQAAGSVFSLFAVSNRFAAILGPLTYGLAAWATGDLRVAALTTALFFVAGAVFLISLRTKSLQEELRNLA